MFTSEHYTDPSTPLSLAEARDLAKNIIPPPSEEPGAAPARMAADPATKAYAILNVLGEYDHPWALAAPSVGLVARTPQEAETLAANPVVARQDLTLFVSGNLYTEAITIPARIVSLAFMLALADRDRLLGILHTTRDLWAARMMEAAVMVDKAAAEKAEAQK